MIGGMVGSLVGVYLIIQAGVLMPVAAAWALYSLIVVALAVIGGLDKFHWLFASVAQRRRHRVGQRDR